MVDKLAAGQETGRGAWKVISFLTRQLSLVLAERWRKLRGDLSFSGIDIRLECRANSLRKQDLEQRLAARLGLSSSATNMAA